MRKAKHYSDKSSFKTALIKISAVQAIFLLGTLILIKTQSWSGIQFAVFYGWFVLPASYLQYFANSPDTIYPALMFYFLSIPIFFFFASSLILTFAWKQKIGKNNLRAIVFFHLVGAIFCVVSSRHEARMFYPVESLSFSAWIIGLLTALLANFFLWRTLFQAVIDQETKTTSASSA